MKVTTTPLAGPVQSVTTAVTTEVLLPSAHRVLGMAVIDMEVGMTAGPKVTKSLNPDLRLDLATANTRVVHDALAVSVLVVTPLVVVTETGVTIPHAGIVAKSTISPEIGLFHSSVTVIVTSTVPQMGGSSWLTATETVYGSPGRTVDVTRLLSLLALPSVVVVVIRAVLVRVVGVDGQGCPGSTRAVMVMTPP